MSAREKFPGLSYQGKVAFVTGGGSGTGISALSGHYTQTSPAATTKTKTSAAASTAGTESATSAAPKIGTTAGEESGTSCARINTDNPSTNARTRSSCRATHTSCSCSDTRRTTEGRNPSCTACNLDFRTQPRRGRFPNL